MAEFENKNETLVRDSEKVFPEWRKSDVFLSQFDSFLEDFELHIEVYANDGSEALLYNNYAKQLNDSYQDGLNIFLNQKDVTEKGVLLSILQWINAESDIYSLVESFKDYDPWSIHNEIWGKIKAFIVQKCDEWTIEMNGERHPALWISEREIEDQQTGIQYVTHNTWLVELHIREPERFSDNCSS